MTRPSPREMLARLIAMPTVSRDSNLALIEHVRGHLASLGVESRLSYDPTGGKANLFATIGGKLGGTGAGGVVLSGHTDVVPVDGQPWSSDPFTLDQRGGRLYGRGTADMKGFVATALALVPEFQAMALKEPIHLAFTYDEEVGCFGVHELIADLKAAGIRPRFAVVGEPTSMQVVNAHKGVYAYRVRFTGVAAHSSQPHRGVSALFAAGRLISFIAGEAADAEARARPGEDYEPPWSSYNVGQIEGGTAINIIPAAASMIWEFRAVPWDDPADLIGRVRRFIDAELRPSLKARDGRADVVLETICEVPGLVPDPDNPAEKAALALTGLNRAGVVSYATEAGVYQQAGIPTIICGPGSIDQAHQPDEFVEGAQIDLCESFLRRLASSLTR